METETCVPWEVPFNGKYYVVYKHNSADANARNGLLGGGSFASVYHCRAYTSATTLQDYAVKAISKAKIETAFNPESAAHRQVRELELCGKSMNSPYVIRLFEHFETDLNLYLAMELIPGGNDLEKELKASIDPVTGIGRFDVEKARTIFRQVVLGLIALHRNGVAHRDLAPKNILYDRRAGRAVVADLGFTKYYIDGDRLPTDCGTREFADPALLTATIHHTGYTAEPADVWSLGVVLHLMLTGYFVFGKAQGAAFAVGNNQYRCLVPAFMDQAHPANAIIAGIPDAFDLLSKMLNSNPNQLIVDGNCDAANASTRITLAAILNHPFFKGGKSNAELLELFGALNPSLAWNELMRAYHPAEDLKLSAATEQPPGLKLKQEEHATQVATAIARCNPTVAAAATATAESPAHSVVPVTLLFHGTATRFKNVLFGREGITDQLYVDNYLPLEGKGKWSITDSNRDVTLSRAANGLTVVMRVIQPVHVPGGESEQSTLQVVKTSGSNDDFQKFILTVIRKMRGFLRVHPNCLPPPVPTQPEQEPQKEK